jgi:hypothetical protein
LHDAIAAERLGIPAVGIMTDRFERSAKIVADMNGLPEYPFVMLTHPVANNSDEVLKQKARDSVVRIVELLTQRDD